MSTLTPKPPHELANFIAASAELYGDVRLGEGSSVWPGVVIRAECNWVTVGRCTNIQDMAMIHIGYAHPVSIGDYCSITHRATLHGCTIEDNCLIGIGATIMDGCVIGRNSIVAGHAFLKEGTEIPPNSIVIGAPGKVVRSYDAAIDNVLNALLYAANGRGYAAGNHRVWSDIDHQALRQEAQNIVGAQRARLDSSGLGQRSQS